MVHSFYDALHGSQEIEDAWKWCWNKLVSPRVLRFCWLARLMKILTMDKLKKRGSILVNGCPLCLSSEETASHLLIHCSYATCMGNYFKEIRNAVGYAADNCGAVFTVEIQGGETTSENFMESFSCCGSVEDWLKRNGRLFKGIGKDETEVVHSIVWTVSEWAAEDGEFKHLSLHKLTISWDACF